MSRQLRLEYPGSLWHVHARGNEKRPTFLDDTDRVRFLEFFAEAVRRFRWIVVAYTLMPNHFHLLIELAAETLSRGMKWLNGSYAQWFNWRHNRVGHLFQGRYKSHIIEKQTYFLEVARYIVLNPVRGYIVEKPEDYEWSSYRATAGLIEPPDWLATQEVLAHFSNDRGVARARYAPFVSAGVNAESPWNNLVGQMYLGSEEFVQRMRDRVELKPRASEHPLAQRSIANPDMNAIVSAIANVMRVPEDRIRQGRGGAPRSLAAWIARYDGLLPNREIAATLRLRSEGQVTKLVRECDAELHRNPVLQQTVDHCRTTICGKK